MFLGLFNFKFDTPPWVRTVRKVRTLKTLLNILGQFRGRTLVSKTRCRGFKSYPKCQCSIQSKYKLCILIIEKPYSTCQRTQQCNARTVNNTSVRIKTAKTLTRNLRTFRYTQFNKKIVTTIYQIELFIFNKNQSSRKTTLFFTFIYSVYVWYILLGIH